MNSAFLETNRTKSNKLDEIRRVRYSIGKLLKEDIIMRNRTRKPIRIGTEHLSVLLNCPLSRKQQGELLQIILEYLFREKEPQNMEPVMKGIWYFVKRDLDYEKRRKVEKAKHGS